MTNGNDMTTLHHWAESLGDRDVLISFLISFGWPILMAYATFRIILIFGSYEDDKFPERVVMGVGGILVWYSRLVFGVPGGGDTELVLGFLLVGMSLMIGPKLYGLLRRAILSDED